MRTGFICSLALCLGFAAGACSQATGSDQVEQVAAPTVELALTGLT